MWTYVIRRLIYNIPVFLTIVIIVMVMLRVGDPVRDHLSKRPSDEERALKEKELGLDRPFLVQYGSFLAEFVTLDFSRQSWKFPGRTVGQEIRQAIVPTLSLTVPALVTTSFLSICIGMLSAFFRGSRLDRTLMFVAVLGMSVSFLVYIILGQYFIAHLPAKWMADNGHDAWRDYWFATQGYRSGLGNWFHFLALPVMISVIVAMGYDTRFYRAVMVEETTRDYITTARAKGASRFRIMFVHMLRNALIPITTRIMITLPFLITGSILLESFFGIPGMGAKLISAVSEHDLPVVETFAALFALLFIISNVLTDVVYALVDPRVRLS